MIARPRNTFLQRLDDVLEEPQRRKHPLPLQDILIEIVLRNGLAIVTTRRKFANLEEVPIEATLTFPVAFEAVLTKLTAHIDGRNLIAIAQDPKQRERLTKALSTTAI